MSLQGAHQINNIIQHMFTQDNFLFYRGNLDTYEVQYVYKIVYQMGNLWKITDTKNRQVTLGVQPIQCTVVLSKIDKDHNEKQIDMLINLTLW